MRHEKTGNQETFVEAGGHPRGSVLRCAGEIDLSSVEALRQALTSSIQAGITPVEVDLTETRYLDSEAIRALLHAHRQLEDRGGSLRLRAQPRTVRLLQKLGLDHVLEVQTT
jgi:anti-anti-sigma factor